MTTNRTPGNTRVRLVSIETYADGHYQIQVQDPRLKTILSARVQEKNGQWLLESWRHREGELPNPIWPSTTYAELDWNAIMQELT